MEEIQSFARTRFDGDSLQQLPRSRTPESGSAPHPQPRATDEDYPYLTSSVSDDSGAWVVNIPRPTTTYYLAEQGLARRNADNEFKRSVPKHHEWDAPPAIERALHVASVSMIKGLELPVELYRGFRDVYYPTPDRPDIKKTYPVRQGLPVR